MTRPKAYRPPNKRRLQLEAWGVFLSFVVVGWCVAGGIWLGLKTLWGLASWLRS